MLSINYLDPNELIDYENNSRVHDAEQIKQIERSIVEFGFTNPILIDDKKGIIAGHGRKQAAINLKIIAVPTITLAGLSDAQKRAYVIADNQLALNASWDLEAIQRELSTLTELDFDVSLLGFSDMFIENMTGDIVENTNQLWQGMPEFDQPNKISHRHIVVHFSSDENVEEFFKLIGQTCTKQTRSIWHPKQVNMDTESKRFADDSGDANE